MPWAYYPDLNKDFTGFFSENNHYGKPGKVFIFFALLSIMLFIIPTVWAKRLNQFVGVLAVAYTAKNYFLFTSCYAGTCPEKKFGLFILIVASLILLVAAMLPDMRLKNK